MPKFAGVLVEQKTTGPRFKGIPVDQEQPQEKSRGIIGGAMDLGRSVGAGSNALMELAGTLYGLTTGDMENYARDQGARGRQYWNDRKSPYLKSLEQQRKAKVDAAQGEIAKLGTAFWETFSSPSLLASYTFEQIPNLIITGGAGRAAGTAANALLKRTGQEASEKIAASAASAGAVGAGATMQGSDVGGQAYEQLMALPDDVWLANPQLQEMIAGNMDLYPRAKRQLATELSQDSAIASGIVSIGVNSIPIFRILEDRLAGLPGAGTRLSGAAKGFAGESLGEGIEEGSGVAISNVATAQVDPTKRITEGVGEAAGMGLAAGPMGAIAGATGPRKDLGQADIARTIFEAPDVDSAIDAATQALDAFEMPGVDFEAPNVPRPNPPGYDTIPGAGMNTIEFDETGMPYIADRPQPMPGSQIPGVDYRTRRDDETDAAYAARMEQEQAARDRDFPPALQQKAEQDTLRADLSPTGAPENPAIANALLGAYIKSAPESSQEARQAKPATDILAALDRIAVPASVRAITMPSGNPFPSEKIAKSSMSYRNNPGSRIVPAASGGFQIEIPEKSDQDWSKFTPETGTLGVPRETMPQIKAEHRGAMVNFLKGRFIGSEIQQVPANTLKPTQAEFSREKVKQALGYEGGNRSILISSDNYVVDGHHQWLASLDGDIQVIRIDAPVQEILDVIKEFPSATSGEAAATPAYSNDLITFASKANSLAEVREFARKQFGPRAPQALEQAITGAWNIRNQEQRRRIGKDDSLATAVAKLGGIKPEWQQDITGDTKANKMIPGVGQVFSKNGTSPDDMALRLLEEGYITQAEYDNMDGRDTLYEALNEELSGGRKKYKLDSDKAQEEMLQAMEDQYAQEEAALKAQREQMYAEIEQKYGAEAADRARLYGDAQDNITDDLLSDIDILNQLNQERDDARETDGEPGITFDEAAGNREPLRDIQGEAQRQPEEAARDQTQDRGAAEPVTSAPAAQAAASSEAVSVSGKEKKPQKGYGENNKLVTKDRADELRKKLKDKLKNQLSSGIDPEIMAMGAELAAFHIEAGARKFADFVVAVADDLGVSVSSLKKYLRSWYNGARDMMEDSGIDVSGMDSAAQVREQFESIVGDQTNAQRPATDSPADRQAGQEQLFEADPVDGRRGRGGRAADEAGAQTGNAQEGSGAAMGERRAPADRKRGNQPVRSEKSRLEADAAGDSDGSRSLPGSTGGLFDDRETGSDVGQVSAKAPAASPVIPSDAPKSVTPANLSEIKKQMPFLTEGQADDVAFAEKRLSKPDGFGVLFTNGTGTGKTFTGLGIVKRSVMAGRSNILVIAPKQPIVDAWAKAGEAFFGLQINKLDSIRDAGKGVVVTTYANIGDNDELLNRDWDLIVADESHYLSSAGDGKDTKALDRIRELTLKRNTASGRVYGKNRALVDQMNAMNSEAEMMRKSDNQEYWYRAGDIQDKADAIRKQLDAMVDAERERIKGVPDAAKPRAVFLSATPFAYEKSVQWANEFLFDWGTDDSGMGYNSGGNYEKFMMTHFGYRMRYNKLTEPDEKVDRGLMQRAFNSWLKREGVLSGRALDSEFDYDRLFVYADNPIGKRVDDAIDWLREKSGGEKEIPGMQEIYEKMIEENFDYHARMYFLEAIKAREAVPQIKAHLAMGRKVLVMHDFKKGGVSNPFRIGFDSNASEMRSAYEMFKEEFSDLINAFDYIPSPISLLTREFPRALVYNGSIPAKKRIDLQNQFNSDADGSPMMMIAQGDAMREGVSIHDTSGKHPRVMIHLGMPTKPTAAIQQEGRTYRTGQASNAMFRYLTIGSSWERFAFASRIASRASAAENLAMGEQARGLKDAFISAYEEADSYLPGFEGEGTGGKERDAAFTSALTPWDTAKSYYFGTKKYKSGRGARGREHSEFFATPEPVGMKMVQWADIRAGESVLEPSAGLGAIARWFPENARNRAIEFSNDLSSRLALHFEGDLMTGDFMDHNIVNKYDAIVMNPPFGQGGKQAAEHVAKALIHLRDNGRVVALIPTGPAADKQFDKLLYDNKETADIFIVADIKLPSVTFERAGTSVSTRILVLEKQTDKERQGQIRQVSRDYSSAETIEELFDRIEGSSVPPRSVPEQVDETPVTSRTATPVVDKNAIQAAQNSAPEGHWAKGPIIEHTTGKGKVITGVVAKIDFAAAKAIDPYTFKKDGGYFIREKHIPAVVTGISGDAPVFSRSTDTTEFKNWFAGSKVVDANGKPLVVYHGAPDARFASQEGIFKSNRERFGLPEDGSNRAFWFARDAAVAKTYADDRRAFDYQTADPGVIAAFLNIQNPLIIDGNGKTWREAQQSGKTSDVIEQAKEAGNDGVIITNVVDDYSSFEGNRTGKATDTYVVFSSNQIKSVNNSGAFDKSNPDIRMARARSATAIPIDRAQALISAITGRLENAPETIVVQSMQDAQVPEIVRREDARQRSQGASGEPEGFYYKGKAHIVLDGLSRKKGESDDQALLRVFSHEVLGHAGLRGLFRNDLENVLNEVSLKRLADVRKKAAEYGLDLADKSQRMEAAEEVLAEMAQTNPENSIVTKAIEAVRRALRRLLMRLPADIRSMLGGSKFTEWVNSMTDAEIIDRFIVPAREFIRGGNQAGMNAMPAFMRSGPWYRSELQQNIGQIRQMANKQGMIGKDQASQWIDAAIKKGLFKAEEVEWTGLKEFIDMADGRLSVDDIQAFVDGNGVRVQEVTLGITEADIEALLDDEMGEGMSREDAIEYLEREDSSPKYATYQLPGGENYREILLTLPTQLPTELPDGFQAVERPGKEGSSRRWIITGPGPMEVNQYASGATRNEAIRKFVQHGHTGKRVFNSSHWENTPNVLAHIRMNDRIDADGSKVLFIEEIQSDWAQEGRKHGFGPRQFGKVFKQENGDNWGVRWPDGSFSGGFSREGADRAALGGKSGKSTPAAPFVTNTKSWTSLALKRIIAIAAEGDYDKVAFINGEQSADRYDLSKQVDSIIWQSFNDGRYILQVTDFMGKMEAVSVENDAELESTIGKELASRIVSEVGNGVETGRYEGLDLKVGGEGMKSFYDQIIPATLKDLSKKLGGDAVERVSIGGTVTYDQLVAAGKATGLSQSQLDAMPAPERKALIDSKLPAQLGITITDAMRDKVASGLPLFSRDMFGGQDDFNLDQYTEEEISQREQMERDRKAQTAKALQKQAADDQLGEFVLTGSDSVADQAAARGQGSLFSRSKALPDTIDIDGVQRSTTNNLGQPIAQTEEGVRNFWAWFGGSKVVDDQGRPLIVKHASREKFTEFRKKNGGIYFTTDGAQAGAIFTEDGAGDAGEYYLSLKAPFDARWKRMGETQKAELREIIERVVDGADVEDAAQKLGVSIEEADPFEVFTDGEFFWGYGRSAQDAVMEGIKRSGYDGVIFPDALTMGEPHTSYVVFDPAQIKSAIGNTGTFDPADNDIRFSRSTVMDSFEQEAESEFSEENRRLREADKTLWNKAKTLLRREFAPGGLLPDSIFREKIARDGKLNVVEITVQSLVKEIEESVRKEYGAQLRNLNETDMRRLSDALAGKMPANMKERTKTAIVAMRQYIDHLSTQYTQILRQQINDLSRGMDEGELMLLDAFLKAGQIEPEGNLPAQKAAATRQRNKIMDEAKEAATAFWGDGKKMQAALGKAAQVAERASLMNIILNNQGKYVHRSYQVFDDPYWYRKIDPAVFDNAMNYLIDRYLEDGTMSRQEAIAKAEKVIDQIVKTDTAYSDMESFIKESKLGAKDLSVLKKRKDIAPEIRALMGEYVDPRINFAKTATKMGRLIFNQKFLDNVLEKGMGTFLFTEEDAPVGTEEIAAEGSEVYAPLNGLFAPREVIQALKDVMGKEQMADWYRLIVQFNGLVKGGKTILSPTTSARNFQSAMFFALANGHWDLTQAKKSMALYRTFDSPAKLAYVKKMIDLGVIYDNPHAQEMMALLSESKFDSMFTSSQTAETIRNAWNLARDIYSFGDDFWKVIGFENEKAKLMKHAGMSEAAAEREAADRIRNLYPTYSMVGKAVQWLRRFPLVGTFVSFPAEIIRTSANMMRTVRKDWKAPGMRRIAIDRALGMTFVAGFAYAAQEIAKAMLDIDDDDEEAIRLQAAPWQRNSNLVITGRDEDGNLQYFDISFLDPYNYFKRPITAIMRDQPMGDALVSAASDMLSPFLGTDIAAGAIMEVYANKTGTGGPVYKESDTIDRQLIDIAQHLRKALQPGFVSNLERTYQALDGQTNASGKKFDLGDEGLSWIGWRVSTLDPKTALYYRSFEFSDAKAEASKTLTEVLNDPNDVSPESIERAYERAVKMRAQAYNDMGKIVGASRRSGLSATQIRMVLKSGSVSEQDRQALMDGRVPAWRPTQQAETAAVRRAEALIGREKAMEIRSRYRMVRTLD